MKIEQRQGDMDKRAFKKAMDRLFAYFANDITPEAYGVYYQLLREESIADLEFVVDHFRNTRTSMRSKCPSGQELLTAMKERRIKRAKEHERDNVYEMYRNSTKNKKSISLSDQDKRNIWECPITQKGIRMLWDCMPDFMRQLKNPKYDNGGQ